MGTVSVLTSLANYSKVSYKKVLLYNLCACVPAYVRSTLGKKRLFRVFCGCFFFRTSKAAEFVLFRSCRRRRRVRASKKQTDLERERERERERDEKEKSSTNELKFEPPSASPASSSSPSCLLPRNNTQHNTLTPILCEVKKERTLQTSVSFFFTQTFFSEIEYVHTIRRHIRTVRTNVLQCVYRARQNIDGFTRFVTFNQLLIVLPHFVHVTFMA